MNKSLDNFTFTVSAIDAAAGFRNDWRDSLQKTVSLGRWRAVEFLQDLQISVPKNVQPILERVEAGGREQLLRGLEKSDEITEDNLMNEFIGGSDPALIQ